MAVQLRQLAFQSRQIAFVGDVLGMSAVVVTAAADDQVHPTGAEKVGRAAAATERFRDRVVVFLWIEPFTVLIRVIYARLRGYLEEGISLGQVKLAVFVLCGRRRGRRLAVARRREQ